MTEDTTAPAQPAHQPTHEFSAILRYFEYEHLPEKLQAVSKPICDIARAYDASLPNCAEKAAGLRKLLEAKDCFVRAALNP